MDIQYSSTLPFHVEFIHRSDKYPEQHYRLEHFVDDEMTLYQKDYMPLIKLRENIPLEVLFISKSKDARFYMDGLELLDERDTEGDNGEVYLTPSLESFTLFEENQYPLIPGYYKVMVVIDGKNYYSLIQIIPTSISEHQWQIMKDELEKELHGLAQDFVRKNLALGRYINTSTPIPTKLLYQFMVINKKMPIIIAVLNDLHKKANFKIVKSYKFVSNEAAKKMDITTVRFSQQHPEQRDISKVPTKKIDYDLLENRWIKKIILVIDKCLNEFIVALSKYKMDLNKEILEFQPYEFQQSTKNKIKIINNIIVEMESFERQAKKVKSAIRVIELTNWFDTVGILTCTRVPSSLILDSRYRSLYEVYRSLHEKDFQVILDSSYSYQWKRTDKLYEMWGFLKIVKHLNSCLGYESITGWLDQIKIKEDFVLIPTLPSNTNIRLKKGDVTLHLFYDTQMPTGKDQTSRDVAPLFSRGEHYRPDLRIDIFKGIIYAGSLIADFKYRNPINVWEEWRDKKRQFNTVMRQLRSYGADSDSVYLYGKEEFENTRPVYEVWAICPKKSNIDYVRDHKIRFLKLCPGENLDFLNDKLEKVIEDALSRLGRSCGL